MASPHKWQFKARFRHGTFGWRGAALASKRLREAVSEIRKVAKKNPVVAGDGVVALMERLWPALEHIDTSSGAMGSAVNRTLEALMPILVKAPADRRTREKWLDRLYQAVQDDGVQYLTPVEERWGEICCFPDLVNQWADMLLPGLMNTWKKDHPGTFFVGTDICLSCLLQAERYDELQRVLSLHRPGFWPYDKFWAKALVRQRQIDEAIAFAESQGKDEYSDWHIVEFCEETLLDAGRYDEAYERYGLIVRQGSTYLAQYRAVVKKYPGRDPRSILRDLIGRSGNDGEWFASARQAGFLDIARDCALSGVVDPKTLIRAARDTAETKPEFCAVIAFRAIDLLLRGRGYETTPLDALSAFTHLLSAARNLGSLDEALAEVEKMLQRPINHEEAMHDAVVSMLSEVRRGG